LRCYNGTSSHPQLLPFAPILKQYNIPKAYLLDLIDGVETDLTTSRFETFDELKRYCYRVASVVGLISLQVFGYRMESTKDYAVNLGYALQLTNILRDVKQDATNGRIYIPQEDLRKFGCSEDEILSGNSTAHFQSLMQFEGERARQYYMRAAACLQREDRAAMFAARTMAAIYFRLLRKIEQANFDVFSKRIAVSTPFKIITAIRFWAASLLTVPA
ncbi:MAG TPA: squalene/phytoene synthase family protein, partial [Candidatus Kapabacteria bacterium]